MERRQLLGLCTFAAMGAWLPSSVAQRQNKIYRLAYISPSKKFDDESAPLREAFEGLRRLGYIEGENILIQRFSSEGDPERRVDVAREAVKWEPDVIFVITGPFAQRVKEATSTIPIVCLTADPISFGLTSSLARPSANVTGGVVDAGLDHWGKKIQILKDIAPSAQKIGFLARRSVVEGTETPAVIRGFQAGAEANKVEWVGVPVDPPMKESEYRRAFGLITKERIDGLVIQDSAENIGYRELIVELVNRAKIPGIYPYRDFVDAGALCTHSMDQFELYRNVVNQVDLILKGTPIQEVPWTRSSNVELVLNMKAAAVIGVQFPASVLSLANEIVE